MLMSGIALFRGGFHHFAGFFGDFGTHFGNTTHDEPCSVGIFRHLPNALLDLLHKPMQYRRVGSVVVVQIRTPYLAGWVGVVVDGFLI
jgi:hypothetical protein